MPGEGLLNDVPHDVNGYMSFDPILTEWVLTFRCLLWYLLDYFLDRNTNSMQSHSIFLMWKSIQKVYMRNVMKTLCIFARNNDRNYSGIHIRVIKPQAIQICMWPVMFAWSTPCCEWLWIWNFYMLNRFKRNKMKMYLCYIPLVHVAKYHLHEEEEHTKLA